MKNKINDILSNGMLHVVTASVAGLKESIALALRISGTRGTHWAIDEDGFMCLGSRISLGADATPLPPGQIQTAILEEFAKGTDPLPGKGGYVPDGGTCKALEIMTRFDSPVRVRPVYGYVSK